MTLPESPLAAGLVVMTLGMLSGAALMLMDRIDEHRVIDRCRTPLEKFVCDVLLAVALSSILLLIYAMGFTAACYYTKKWLPDRTNISC